MSLMITGYREQPKMGPMPPSNYKSPTATRNLTLRGPSQSNASLAITGSQEYSQRMGPMLPSNYKQIPSVNLDLTKTPESLPDSNAKRFSQGSFGIGKEYDKYTKIHQRQIDEGITLEQAMYLSRTATPEDHIRAFGNRNNWRKWGGGNKTASGTNATRMATINRIKSKRAEVNPFSIPSLNNVLMAGDNRGLNRSRDYDVNTGELKGITTDSDFGRRIRDAVYGSSPKA